MTTVYWLTRDLRLDDNPALHEAARESPLVCVFMIDPRWFEPGPFGWTPMGPHRWAFVWRSLRLLEAQLQARGQQLIIRRERPEVGLPALLDALGARRLVASRPTGFNEMGQWQAIETAVPGVRCDLVETLTLFDETDLAFRLDALPETFSAFRRSIEKPGLRPARPLHTPDTLPETVTGQALDQRPEGSVADLSGTPFSGGEVSGADHLARYIWQDQHILTYKRTRNALDDWSSSSKLSPWLSVGALSARRIAAEIDRFETEVERNESTYWLYFELLWREYFQWYGRHRGRGLFLSPANQGQGGGSTDAHDFRRWLTDPSTHALVRAGAVQLESTGYLSNRMRQILASACLHEGHFDWRLAAAWFEHWLVDYDVASNYGNWQYIAGVGADPRGGRVFSLDKQARQFDADGTYRQRWLSET